MNIIIYYIFVTDMYFFLYLFRFVLNSQVHSQAQAPQCQVSIRVIGRPVF